MDTARVLHYNLIPYSDHDFSAVCLNQSGDGERLAGIEAGGAVRAGVHDRGKGEGAAGGAAGRGEPSV